MSEPWEALPDITPKGASWEDLPDVAPAAPVAGPSAASSLGRGVVQGGSMGFADELGGAEQALLMKLPAGLQRALGGSGFKDDALTSDIYAKARDENRAQDAAAREAHPVLYGGGELAGGVASSFVPGLGLGRGAGLGATLLKTALAGGLAGAGNSTAADGMGLAKDTAVGAGLGAGLGLAGRGLGRLGQKAAQGVTALDETVARKAAQEAASDTGTARSMAGNAAQDTYKQLEHLRETGTMRALSPEEAQVAHDLEMELGAKAKAKLLPSAARKTETATAYSEAMSTEAARAEAAAAEKLSGGELKRQLLSRALRYGLPAVGGAVMGLGGHGTMAGAGLGALAGAGMRPMMHSLLRMAKQPVVQRPLLQAASFALGDLAPAIERSAGAEPLRLTPQVQEWIAALRRSSPDEAMAQGGEP